MCITCSRINVETSVTKATVGVKVALQNYSVDFQEILIGAMGKRSSRVK